jgi:hypothetical protein
MSDRESEEKEAFLNDEFYNEKAGPLLQILRIVDLMGPL